MWEMDVDICWRKIEEMWMGRGETGELGRRQLAFVVGWGSGRYGAHMRGESYIGIFNVLSCITIQDQVCL